VSSRSPLGRAFAPVLPVLRDLQAAGIRFLVHPAGFDFASAWARRESVELDGVQVHSVALEDLLAMKRAAGRPKDLGDLEALEEIRRLRRLRRRPAGRKRPGKR
jgi:hypothetical protein